jgi:hypothetical protein
MNYAPNGSGIARRRIASTSAKSRAVNDHPIASRIPSICDGFIVSHSATVGSLSRTRRTAGTKATGHGAPVTKAPVAAGSLLHRSSRFVGLATLSCLWFDSPGYKHDDHHLNRYACSRRAPAREAAAARARSGLPVTRQGESGHLLCSARREHLTISCRCRFHTSLWQSQCCRRRQ